jgi:hypothetical protein
MQEQINEKTVALTIKSTRLTGRLLAKVMRAALRKMKQARDAPPHGRQTLKQLAKQNAGLSNIEITNRNIKSFEPYARKYGIDYALKKDASVTPPKWLVFFKGRDADAMTAAFSEFSAKTLKRNAARPSVLAQLNKFKELVKNTVIDRVKNKDRGGPER